MSETLHIQNFLVIKKAEITLRKINVMVGPQASGKSVIAKLCHFFKDLSKHFTEGINTQKNRRELDKLITTDFCKRFPRYTWDGHDFSIQYTMGDFCITLDGKKSKTNKTKITMKFNKELTKIYASRKKILKDTIEQREKDTSQKELEEKYPLLLKNTTLVLNKSKKYNNFFSKTLFIPASRSFFANIQKNIFSFMSHNIELDTFLIEFGATYEVVKRLHENVPFIHEDKKLERYLKKLISTIIDGDYQYHQEQDWIVKKENKTNIAHASSGQQESLPMLLVLFELSILGSNQDNLFFIEEPEAHLFPTAQSQVMAFLSHLYAEFQSSFFLTSHSPYLLSALNNHILAAEVVQAGKMEPEMFTELNGYGVPIPFEDVSAYTINNGEVISIRDEEYQMISGDMLDGVSEHFAKVTEKLLELRR